MGYSYGAVLAGRFAKAYPDLVDGVIMGSPTFTLKVPHFEPAQISFSRGDDINDLLNRRVGSVVRGSF
jgi:alpha-beta hydrolase superfamily lysophospholipase